MYGIYNNLEAEAYACKQTQILQYVHGMTCQMRHVICAKYTHLSLAFYLLFINHASVSSRKWQDKADLLTRLESQVKRMKEGFDAKEKALLEEKDKASQAHK